MAMVKARYYCCWWLAAALLSCCKQTGPEPSKEPVARPVKALTVGNKFYYQYEDGKDNSRLYTETVTGERTINSKVYAVLQSSFDRREILERADTVNVYGYNTTKGEFIKFSFAVQEQQTVSNWQCYDKPLYNQECTFIVDEVFNNLIGSVGIGTIRLDRINPTNKFILGMGTNGYATEVGLTTCLRLPSYPPRLPRIPPMGIGLIAVFLDGKFYGDSTLVKW